MDNLRLRRKAAVYHRFGCDAWQDYADLYTQFERQGCQPAVAHARAWRELESRARVQRLVPRQAVAA